MSKGQASAEVRGALAEAHRRQWAFVLAATVRLAGDLFLLDGNMACGVRADKSADEGLAAGGPRRARR